MAGVALYLDPEDGMNIIRKYGGGEIIDQVTRAVDEASDNLNITTVAASKIEEQAADIANSTIQIINSTTTTTTELLNESSEDDDSNSGLILNYQSSTDSSWSGNSVGEVNQRSYSYK